MMIYTKKQLMDAYHDGYYDGAGDDAYYRDHSNEGAVLATAGIYNMRLTTFLDGIARQDREQERISQFKIEGTSYDPSRAFPDCVGGWEAACNNALSKNVELEQEVQDLREALVLSVTSQMEREQEYKLTTRTTLAQFQKWLATGVINPVNWKPIEDYTEDQSTNAVIALFSPAGHTHNYTFQRRIWIWDGVSQNYGGILKRLPSKYLVIPYHAD